MLSEKRCATLLLVSLLFGAQACSGDEGHAPVDASSPSNRPDYAGGKGDIIGEDDRRDEFSQDVSEKLRETARSTAMLIDNTSLLDQGDGTTVVTSVTLGQSYYMCPDERFVEQPAAGFCSAWLIAPDIMMTNGHCITSQSMCENSSFVFDYARTEEGSSLDVIPSETIVSCERVLYWDNSSFCDTDFAVVKLSRPVMDREPVKVRHPTRDAFKSDDLVIIGHPFGLPRKYALNGQVIHEGSDAFLTSHDIFGGNSGSAMFDAETGEVQGLVACGGSNYDWYEIEGEWTLETKTGKACDQTCDDAGLYGAGQLDATTCAEGGDRRRRCSCDGRQLVWESRACLAFEDDTQGTCTREVRYEQRNCIDSPWLCATPVAQHTSVFYRHVGPWQSVASREPVVLTSGETTSIDVVIDEEGVIASASLSLDFSSLPGVFDADPFAIRQDLTIDLHPPADTGLEPLAILHPDDTDAGADALAIATEIMGKNAHSSVETLDLPIDLFALIEQPAKGTYRLEITNTSAFDVTLHEWALNLRVASREEVEDVTLFGPCFGLDCVDFNVGWPEPEHEPFDSDPSPYDMHGVTGTIGAGLSVEVFDESGLDYEVFKTRSSQTLSLTRGEFAIVKAFESSIGARDVTLDYRYDGEGWFQIWADDQIIFSESSFSQQAVTVAVPDHARTLKFVLGASDDSRIHELTLFDLIVSSPDLSMPAE